MHIVYVYLDGYVSSDTDIELPEDFDVVKCIKDVLNKYEFKFQQNAANQEMETTVGDLEGK